MSFEIGAAAIDRAESLDASGWGDLISSAVISQSSPCVVGVSSIGHITNIDIYLTVATTGLRFGTAYKSGNRWKIRDCMSAVVAGSVGPGLVNVDGIDLTAIDGDMIVVYAINLHIDMGDTGDGYVKFDLPGNPFTITNPLTAEYSGTVTTGKTLSIYAYGYIETPKPVTGQYEKFERNELNDDASDDFSNTNYVCQTFTVGTLHKLQRVEVKLIATGNCGAVTMSVYATDTTGKPTGSVLASCSNSRVPAITSAAEWVSFVLTSPITLEPKTYAIVLSAAAGGAWARYETVGSYTAGYLWESTDSGTTWTKQEEPDLLFREYGLLIQSFGSYTVHLYPRTKGTHTQLVPAYAFRPATVFNADIDNYSCVDDLADSPDEDSTAVMFAVGTFNQLRLQEGWNNFLSGASEYRAGYLKSSDDTSYNLWQSRVNGLTSPGNSLFTKQLEVGDILRSPTQNDWYGQYRNRLSRILSIEDDQNLTLAADPNLGWVSSWSAPNPAKSWYVTPCSVATADNPPDPRAPVAPDNLPLNYMQGTWSWTKDSKIVTGVGGNALDELIWPSAVLRSMTPGLGWRPNTSSNRLVHSVEDDNNFTLSYDFSWHSRTDTPEKTNYITYSFKDEYGDEATETQFCKPTKRDSYGLKATLNKNPILAVQVVFRVCVALIKNDTWDSITGTAQPFLKLNGLDSLGTEITIPSVLPVDVYLLSKQPVWFTIRQSIGRPGGGVFTREDINNMEVGIILGNLGGTVEAYIEGRDPINAPAVVACTQLYVDVIMSRRSQQQGADYYITQYGQRVFDNGFDEWSLPVFDFSMNQCTHWIYGTIISDFIAKPIAILRKITSKILHRHRVSRSIIRGKTSKEI